MARRLYTLVLWLLLPWALLHLLWRSRRQREYLQHWSERFALYRRQPSPQSPPTIWIHAVSVGETRAAQPLIAALRERYPSHRILLTQMTPTGRQTGIELFGDSIARVYLPYDFPSAINRFLDHWQPVFGLIMETELWPNLISACHQRGLPLMLVNGRLSEKSARRYARFAALSHGALANLAGVAAQTETDAQRLASLGAKKVVITGNLKFDITPPAEQLALGAHFRQLLGRRKVLLCASTRDGEEAHILTAWHHAALQDTLLVIVPRHPQRVESVANLISAHGFKLQRRSSGLPLDADTQVWLGDSMGEMFAWYAAVDVAFIGGSLKDYGCQNLIEACAVGTPVLIGPSTYNFAEAAREALACGAAHAITDADDLVRQMDMLLTDVAYREQMSRAGREFAARHRGATAHTLELISSSISSSISSTVR